MPGMGPAQSTIDQGRLGRILHGNTHMEPQQLLPPCFQRLNPDNLFHQIEERPISPPTMRHWSVQAWGLVHGEGQRSGGCGHEQRRRRGQALLLQRATLLGWSAAAALGCPKTCSRLMHTSKHFAGASMKELTRWHGHLQCGLIGASRQVRLEQPIVGAHGRVRHQRVRRPAASPTSILSEHNMIRSACPPYSHCMTLIKANVEGKRT